MSSEEEFAFVWDMIYFPLVVFMFFINCFSDVAPRYSDAEKSDVRNTNLNIDFTVIHYAKFFKIESFPRRKRINVVGGHLLMV